MPNIDDFKVIALISFRNEELYLDTCLNYLISQGIFVYLIDNDSQDDSNKIARKYLNKGVIAIDRLPFSGVFELKRILDYKHQVCHDLDADWFIHHDADEIHQSPKQFSSLYEGIRQVDKEGCNTINFDEFVFVPLDGKIYEGRDYLSEMRHYYFFQPSPLRLRRAWRKQLDEVDAGAGHILSFPSQRIYPHNFILRHYIVLSADHAIRKYARRKFPQAELDRGWHSNRAQFTPDKLDLSHKLYIKTLTDDAKFDCSDPVKHHEFLGDLPDEEYNRSS